MNEVAVIMLARKWTLGHMMTSSSALKVTRHKLVSCRRSIVAFPDYFLLCKLTAAMSMVQTDDRINLFQ